ncbi:hypothetical protein JZU48_05000 [bacterium]|jgi:hypothetical protein|nr:hypothetical protein [bacterium]
MTDAQTALSRRLVTSAAFRWAPGMKVDQGFRVTESYERFMFPVDRPDLTDAATAGALLSLLLAAARARFIVVEIEDDWRTRHAEVRLVDVVAGGWHTRAAFVDMPLGEAVALALLSLEDAPTSG